MQIDPDTLQMGFLAAFVTTLALTAMFPRGAVSYALAKRIIPRAILCGIIIILFAVFLYVYIFLPSRLMFPNTNITLLPLFLGFAAAIASVQLRRATRSQASAFATVSWALLVVLATALGLFSHTAPQFLSLLREARIETTGITVVLAEQGSAGSDMPVFDIRQNPLEFERRADYEFGISGLQTLTKKAIDDVQKIQLYCSLETIGQKFCSTVEELQPSLELSSDYFRELSFLSQCLSGYAERFPNGLPIQEELSEIAISYANRSWARPDVLRQSASSSDATPEEDFKRIVDKVSDIKVLPVAGSGASSEPGKSPIRCGDYLQSDDLWVKLEDILKGWSHGVKTPHRSLMESYVIVAAGYPYDAAQYLKRDFELETDYLHRFGRFANWIFSFRVLASLEQIYEHTEEYTLQEETLKKLNSSYSDFFRELLGVKWNDLVYLVASCGGWRYQFRFTEYLVEELKKEKKLEEFQLYVVQSIYSNLASEVRQWQLVASNATRDRMTLRERSDKFASLFEDKTAYDDCFSFWVDRSAEPMVVERELERTFDELGVTAGMLRLAEFLELVNARSMFSEKVSEEEKRRLLCEARDLFIAVSDRAWRGAGGLDGERALSAEGPELGSQRRIRKFVRLIDDTDVEC